jgi:hypothetical protein
MIMEPDELAAWKRIASSQDGQLVLNFLRRQLFIVISPTSEACALHAHEARRNFAAIMWALAHGEDVTNARPDADRSHTADNRANRAVRKRAADARARDAAKSDARRRAIRGEDPA